MILYNNPPKKLDGIIRKNNYVFRGSIYRNSKLDQISNIVVARVVMVCCFYDSCAYGLRIKQDDISQYKMGDWVKVYGHFVPFKPDNLEKDAVIADTPNTEIKEDFMFAADKIIPDKEPDNPFMSDFKEKEPFVY